MQYLNATKPVQMSIVQSFNKFFSDYSMTNFSYYGVERAEYPKTPKKAMKKYNVFTTCMLGRALEVYLLYLPCLV